MKSKNIWIIVVVAFMIALVWFAAAKNAGAVAVDEIAVVEKVNICHYTHSESNPIEAIRVNADAFDGEGDNDHTLHGDFLYGGPVNEDNQQPLKPEGDEWCEGEIPEPTPTEEVTPTPTVDVTPTATPSSSTSSGPVDDGLGCGHHDCSGNKTAVPSAPPATGRGR